jgi:Concanavalin A-like lectin/glucanases superfamily
MRMEAAIVLVLASLGWCASPASATTNVLADWRLDEGSGQIAADSGASGATGRLGSAAGADAADPTWTAGHDGGAALTFGGGQYVAVPDRGALESAHVTVDAWVRHSGSPGIWRYVLSKGAVGCDRSSYGLYSGWAGGMSFYVSDATHYSLSPEVPVSFVWDGAWHHVVGSYDGSRVRLFVDGALVGNGTPATLSIAYGIGSRNIYLGTYLGSCERGFQGDIDDVRILSDGQQPTPGQPVIQPTPGTPTQLAVPGGGSVNGAPQRAKATAPRACLNVSLSRRTVALNKRTRVVATVRRGKKGVVGVRVAVKGAGVSSVGRTNRNGRAGFNVRAHKRGRLTVRIRGESASCAARTVRAI